jgi:hypothetical protein
MMRSTRATASAPVRIAGVGTATVECGDLLTARRTEALGHVRVVAIGSLVPVEKADGDRVLAGRERPSLVHVGRIVLDLVLQHPLDGVVHLDPIGMRQQAQLRRIALQRIE